MPDYIEIAAVVTGILYVMLASRQIVWCWLSGIISSLLYIYINVTHSLFQDAILQTYYVFAGFYGWWLWTRKTNDNTETTEVITASGFQIATLIVLGVVAFPACGYVFSKFGNSLSYFDAAVTIFSFIATWMTTKKIIQNWIFWIVIDVIASLMYYIKGLHLTSALYFIFAVLAIYGYFEWKKQITKA